MKIIVTCTILITVGGRFLWRWWRPSIQNECFLIHYSNFGYYSNSIDPIRVRVRNLNTPVGDGVRVSQKVLGLTPPLGGVDNSLIRISKCYLQWLYLRGSVDSRWRVWRTRARVSPLRRPVYHWV